MQHCSVTFTEYVHYLNHTRPTGKLRNALEILVGNWKIMESVENISLGMHIMKSDSN